jgi:hypothetical protein
MTTNEGAFYYPPLEDLPIFDVLVFRNAQKVIDLAINSDNTLITNTTSGATYYPTFVDSSSGYERIRTNAPTYTYNADTNTLSANTSGSSGSASTIALTSDDTSGTYWIPFSKTTSATSNSLFIDDTTTPLSYNPFTSTLTATNFDGLASESTKIEVTEHIAPSLTTYYPTFTTLGAGQKDLLIDTVSLNYYPDTSTLSCTNFQGVASNAYLVRAQDTFIGTTFYLPFINGSTTGYYDLNVSPNITYDYSTNGLNINVLSNLTSITPSNARSVLFNGTPIGNGGNTSCVFMGINAGTQPPNIAPNNNFCFGTNAGSQLTTGGVQNLCIGANSGNLLTSGNRNTFLGPSASRFATTAYRNTTVGGASQSFPDSLFTGNNNTILGYDARLTADPCSFTTIIGSDVTCGTSNTVQIGRASDTTIFDGTVTNTIAQPASSDSSTKMPTTAWVQTAITAGSVTNASKVNITNTTSGTTFYPTFVDASTGNEDIRTNNSAFTYNATSNTISANTSGTAGIATQVTLSNTASGASNFLVMSTTNSGTSSLLTDTAGATYDSTTNTAAINISGSSASATGNAATATAVALTSDISAFESWVIFSKTRTTTNNPLYYDNTKPLTYQASTGTLKATIYNIPTTVASTISSSGTTISLTNNNIGGTYDFTVSTSGLPLTILSLNETNSFYRVPFVVSAQSAPTNIRTFSVSNSVSSIGVDIIAESSASSKNPLIVASDSVIFGNNTAINTSDLVLTTWSATTAGVRITPTTALIGAGGTAAAPTANASFSGTTVTVTGNTQFVANNITLSGTNINVGQGAGAANNLILGNTNAKSVVFTPTGANTLVGTSVGNSMTATAGNNTCVGNGAGQGITSANNNTFIGERTGFQTANGTGLNNTCVGFVSGLAMTTTATQNTLIGSDSASALTSGTGNTVVGFGAAGALLTGASNTIIGLQAGDLITGSFNTCIGSGSSVPTAGGSNQIAIGTATETMFIRGALNYRIGTTITPTGINQDTNLSGSPLAQFYIVNIGFTGCTITLEAPSNARCVGTIVTFKRRTGNVAFTITTGTGFNFFQAINGLGVVATITVAAGVFQTSFISDGLYWCEMNRT